MKNESILYGTIGLLLGIVAMGFFATFAVNNNNNDMMGMMRMNTSKIEKQMGDNHGSMSMAGMTEQLKNKSGDDFDKAFVEMMIAHHEGAIEMAELIPSRAKHNELKTLGEAVVSAQTKEVNEMKQWQKDWGYSSDEMMHMMHGER